MTRKDYEAIAAAIAGEFTLWNSPDEPNGRTAKCVVLALGQTMRKIADKLAADNPRFDRARFIRACHGR